MAAATITNRLETNDPTEENVVITVTDGETYVSRKFGAIDACHASFNEDQGSLSIPLSVALSGSTVTVHCAGMTDQKVLLTLLGRK